MRWATAPKQPLVVYRLVGYWCISNVQSAAFGQVALDDIPLTLTLSTMYTEHVSNQQPM
jgi:hypothetical protein